MAHEGMVHALVQIHRLLKPDGRLIDIHPIPEGYLIKAIKDGRVLFSEPKRENCSLDVLQAEKALAEIIERELFAVDQRAEFDFLIYASSVQALRNHVAELNAFEDDPMDEISMTREELLYAQLDGILRASGSGTEAAIHERVRITSLRPLPH